MTKWKAVQIVMGAIPLGIVEAQTEEEARRMAAELCPGAPAQNPCPACEVHRFDEGVAVQLLDED